MLYELAYLNDGQIVHGGIKAPLLTVGKWLKQNTAQYPDGEYFIIPANSEAVTEQEFLAEVEEEYPEQL